MIWVDECIQRLREMIQGQGEEDNLDTKEVFDNWVYVEALNARNHIKDFYHKIMIPKKFRCIMILAG